MWYSFPFFLYPYKYSPSNINSLLLLYFLPYPYLILFIYSPSNINLPVLLYDFTFPLIFPFKYSPSNINIFLSYSFIIPFPSLISYIILPNPLHPFPDHLLSFKYSPSNIKLPLLSYSFPFPFLFPFIYTPSNIIRSL